MRKLVYIFLLLSLICHSQSGRYIPLGQLGNSTGTTVTFGTIDSKTLNIRSNGSQRFSIDDRGVLRLSILSSTIIGATDGNYWYSDSLGFAYFKVAHSGNNRGATFGMCLTDSSITTNNLLENDKVAGIPQPWFGLWYGTRNNNAVHIMANNENLLSVLTVTNGSGATIINPATSSYTTDSRFRINRGRLPYIMTCVNGTVTPFSIDSTLSANVIMPYQCVIGGTTISTPTCLVIGTGSVSTTSTVNSLICQSTMSVGTTSTLTGNVGIGGGNTTGNALSVIGAISCSTTFSAGSTSTLTSNVRIGSTVAPTATLHIAGTASVSGTSTLNTLRNTGTVTASTSFSCGGTATIGGILSLTNYTPTAVADGIVIGSATLDFPQATATTVSDLTIAVVGARLNDKVSVGVPNASVTATAKYYGWVSATDVVKIRFTPKATEDPASGVFKITVCKN